MARIIRQREERTCLNCGKTVEAQYCSYCGQENIHPKQPFHYLLTHFIGVKINYKHGLWSSICTLFRSPGFITKSYIKGQRVSYTDPVNMYVAISFVVFLLPFLLPHPKKDTDGTPISKHTQKHSTNTTSADEYNRSLVKRVEHWGDEEAMFYTSEYFKNVKTVAQLDSIQNNLPETKKVNAFAYGAERKYLSFREKGLSNDTILDKYTDSLEHNLTKFLICYLPIFTLFLWLFHDRRKWSYFEHSVFTFYYFCFLLLLMIPLELVDFVDEISDSALLEKVEYCMMGFVILYSFAYFVRAHHAVYAEKKNTARMKGFALLTINAAFMFLCFVCYMILVGYLLH